MTARQVARSCARAYPFTGGNMYKQGWGAYKKARISLSDNKIDIKELVRKAGTRKAVADALGVCLRSVVYWADGSRDPSYRHFLQLCKLAKHDPRSVHFER